MTRAPKRHPVVLIGPIGTAPLRLLPADAETLQAQGKLQKCIDAANRHCYSVPRSWRQMARDEWPAPHPDVLALAAKAQNRQVRQSHSPLFTRTSS